MSQPDSPPVQPLVEALTAREQEVLAHLAANRSNRKIADALVVSLNTVKWYNRQIYGKLGVSDRRQAVSRARGLGLLPAIHPQVQTQGSQEPQTERAPPSVRRPTPAYKLPASPTPFFGRASELAALEATLTNPATRLVTLTGLGGSGKTRLALQLSPGCESYSGCPSTPKEGRPTCGPVGWLGEQSARAWGWPISMLQEGQEAVAGPLQATSAGRGRMGPPQVEHWIARSAQSSAQSWSSSSTS